MLEMPDLDYKNIPDSTIFLAARGNCKSGLAMELYRRKIGIPDDVWVEMKREVKKAMFGEGEENDPNNH